jgi:hypothetical protein
MRVSLFLCIVSIISHSPGRLKGNYGTEKNPKTIACSSPGSQAQACTQKNTDPKSGTLSGQHGLIRLLLHRFEGFGIERERIIAGTTPHARRQRRGVRRKEKGER